MAVAAVGILLTGVLPGLAVLGIFSTVTGKSALFWKSQGQAFVDSAKEDQKPDSEPSCDSGSSIGG